MKAQPLNLALMTAVAALAMLSVHAQSPGATRPSASSDTVGQDRMRDTLGAALRGADTNRDGKWSREEVAPLIRRFPEFQFEAVDTNKDGQLTQDELRAAIMRAAPRELSRALLRDADKNKDEKISKREFAAAFPDAPERAFQALDRNGDGVLSREDAAPPVVTPRSSTEREAFVRPLLLKADANGDGRVSFEELVAKKPGFPEETFTRADANGDGVLSEADIPASSRKRKPTR